MSVPCFLNLACPHPDTLILGDAGRTCIIQAGMEGRADIVSREETVLQFLLRKARLIADV